MVQKTGSETMGAAGDKSRMTLFKDDRSEDMGAILLSAVIIAIVMMISVKKPAPMPAPAVAPAAVTAPASAPAEPAKK